jgi:hypothetical protein
VLQAHSGIAEQVVQVVELQGLAIGFRTSWKLTLVIFACAPLFAIALGFVIAIAINGEKKGRVAYSRAGGAANDIRVLR